MSVLPRLSVTVPERAVPAVVAAFETACEAVSFLRLDEACDTSRRRAQDRRCRNEASCAMIRHGQWRWTC